MTVDVSHQGAAILIAVAVLNLSSCNYASNCCSMLQQTRTVNHSYCFRLYFKLNFAETAVIKCKAANLFYVNYKAKSRIIRGINGE
jgi:hypothetical protein